MWWRSHARCLVPSRTERSAPPTRVAARAQGGAGERSARRRERQRRTGPRVPTHHPGSGQGAGAQASEATPWAARSPSPRTGPAPAHVSQHRPDRHLLPDQRQPDQPSAQLSHRLPGPVQPTGSPGPGSPGPLLVEPVCAGSHREQQRSGSRRKKGGSAAQHDQRSTADSHTTPLSLSLACSQRVVGRGTGLPQVRTTFGGDVPVPIAGYAGRHGTPPYPVRSGT